MIPLKKEQNTSIYKEDCDVERRGQQGDNTPFVRASNDSTAVNLSRLRLISSFKCDNEQHLNHLSPAYTLQMHLHNSGMETITEHVEMQNTNSSSCDE